MISRLMMSLKKASRARESGWSPDALSRTHVRTFTQMEFERPQIGPQGSCGTTSDELELSTFSELEVKGRSSEGVV
jgi:hypothetical protein